MSTTVSHHEDTTNHPNTASALHVIKRDGSPQIYDATRIQNALKAAFLDTEGDQASGSNRVESITKTLTREITQTLHTRFADGGTIHIETIQDMVELSLMRAGEHKIAREYVLYREKRHQARLAQMQQHREAGLDNAWLRQLTEQACVDLDDVQAEPILQQATQNLFQGASTEECLKALMLSARTLVETEPNYTYVTARLLLHSLYDEALSFLNIEHLIGDAIKPYYKKAFKAFISQGVTNGIVDPKLKSFDLDKLANALMPERDQQFTYLSLQTLYDRYFIHEQGVRYELPQVCFMRVAMGLALHEDNREDRAIAFYHLLSSFDYMSSTPTLFNAGTTHSQLSSCYLTTVPDDLDGIYSAIRDNALLSKFAGGLGNDWTPVRALGAHIKGTNGKSLGVVPFLNVADATAVAVNQGGKRKGAVVAYLATWHLDIEEFLELRKNTGDERRRTHDMNTANWIPDLFMKRVFANEDWTLFSPNEVTDLHDLTGLAFEKAYAAHEAKAKKGQLQHKTLPAVKLWRKMLGMLFETGHPWMTFKDPCNLRSPQQHCGVVHSSNLCTEITLNTSEKEIAVCNLGSVNLVQHIKDGKLDMAKLESTINTAIRMLDNVIDINYYAVPQAHHANMQHRPIGLGIMGFQDALYKLNLRYNSQEAVDFADTSMEAVSYYAIQASSNLAKERGKYNSYRNSLWDQGILPIDSIALLKNARGRYLEQNTDTTMDWASLRQKVKKQGMRNSNTMAIAPTATISNLCGISQSIEPTYQNLYVKSNLSGEFTVVNPYLADDLKALDLWDSVMIHDLKYYNGSVQKIKRIPEHIKEKYRTAFEVEPRYLVEAASRRQKWLDQSQSLNLYIAKPSGKQLDLLYKMAWLRGLKTTYYLRSVSASNTEKSTIHDSALNAVQANTAPQACAIDDPDCEACQ